MTVAAPPRPPQVDESAGHDPGEALIKEAQQRARRRRWIYGGAAIVVAIAAVAAFTIPAAAARRPRTTRRRDVPRRPPSPLGAPLVRVRTQHRRCSRPGDRSMSGMPSSTPTDG